MYVKKLRLRDFRNFESAEIEFHPHLNLITGENAQGKTNLLESLAILSLTKSHRISDDQQLIRIGSEAAKISCIYEEEGESRLEVILHPMGKTLVVNGQPVRRSSEFIGHLNAVLFSPDDLGIFADSPRERRKMLDQEIIKLSPAYLKEINRYQALLKDRNIALKQPAPDALILDTLDEQMIQETVPILKERQSFIEDVNAFMPDIYGRLSATDSRATVSYHSFAETAEAGALRRKYHDIRSRDIETRVTNIGLHREDLAFFLNDTNVIYTASQGQKRMCLLAFKLALLETIRKRTGRNAVLLLDDVLSELDRARQEALLACLQERYQCILTATEIPELPFSGGYEEYRIISGTVKPIQRGRR